MHSVFQHPMFGSAAAILLSELLLDRVLSIGPGVQDMSQRDELRSLMFRNFEQEMIAAGVSPSSFKTPPRAPSEASSTAATLPPPSAPAAPEQCAAASAQPRSVRPKPQTAGPNVRISLIAKFDMAAGQSSSVAWSALNMPGAVPNCKVMFD